MSPSVRLCLHLPTSCRVATSCHAPLLLWCPHLFSTQAFCCITPHHAATSHIPAPLLLTTPPPLIVSLLCLLSGWLLRCLSSCQCLLSTGTSNYCCTLASCCAHLVPLVHSGWLSCSCSLWWRPASASAFATKELSPSHGLDLDCDAKLRIPHQAGNNEKNLVVCWVQTDLIGKVGAMVIACIECKHWALERNCSR